MRIIIFIIFSILLVAPTAAQSLEEELTQIYLILDSSISTIENGLNDIDSGTNDSEKATNKSELALEKSEKALNESEKEAAISKQQLNISEQLRTSLDKSFSDYRKKVEKQLGWSKIFNKVLIVGMVVETIILVLK